MPPTDREQRILAAYAAGHTTLQIAVAEDRSQQRIRQILCEHNVCTPKRRSSVKPSAAAAERLNDAAWLAAEYATKNMPQIAGELGVTHTHVRRALERAGIPVRSRRAAALVGRGLKDRDAIQERAAAMYLAGSPVKAIAAELGVRPHQVSGLLRELRVLGAHRKRPGN